MDPEYFLSIHLIFISENNFKLIESTKNKIIIDYLSQIQITYLFEQSNFQIILTDNKTVGSQHIIRLLNKQYNFIQNQNILKINIGQEDKIQDFLLNLNEILNSNTNLCTICGKELEIKGTGLISSCTNLNCKKEYYSLVTDSRVTEIFNKDPKVFEFLLYVTLTGISHPKGELAFKPLPLIPNTNTLEQLKKIVSTELEPNKISGIINQINSSSDDIELYGKITPLTYCILKNVVSDNYFSMSSRENVLSDTSVVFVHINYSASIENKFQQKHYLFHGSSIYSWYPIVKNGLKVMSGSALQANGAAYGNGIYFSDSFQFALGYSQNRINNNNFTCPYNVVGVFEILEEPTKFKKAPNIFVISDDSILLLRSLVLVKPGSKISKDITNYFTKDIPQQKQINKLSLGMVKNKRLESEYKKLLNEPYIEKIDQIDQFNWNIILSIKSNSIHIEFKFSNYPISPPDIKLISKVKINGLVDQNNQIKIPLTNPNNWKITNNLVEITCFLYKCFEESI